MSRTAKRTSRHRTPAADARPTRQATAVESRVIR